MGIDILTEAEPFWTSEPTILYTRGTLIPTREMTNSQRLNALTRLLLIIVLVILLSGRSQLAITVLILGLLLIMLLRTNQPQEHFSSEQALRTGVRGFMPGVDPKPNEGVADACWFDVNNDMINAVYEVTPKIQFNHDDAAKRSYMNAKYELTPLRDTDGFKDIWRSEPGMCGGYSMIPDPQTVSPIFDPDTEPQPCNYIVRSKIDHVPVDPANTGLNSVRATVEAAFVNDMMDFRAGLMNEHIDRFRRERQHNCADMRLLTTTSGGGGSI